jgi:hypothetical protein
VGNGVPCEGGGVHVSITVILEREGELIMYYFGNFECFDAST